MIYVCIRDRHRKLQYIDFSGNSNEIMLNQFEETSEGGLILEINFPECLNLHGDQRDEFDKKFDFILKSGKEIIDKTDLNTDSLMHTGFKNELLNQNLKRLMELDCPTEKKNLFQKIPEHEILKQKISEQSLIDLDDLTRNSNRKYMKHAIKSITRVSLVDNLNMLNQRRDVINKTLLRIIKRFFMKEVDISTIKSRYLSAYLKGKEFETIVNKYVNINKS